MGKMPFKYGERKVAILYCSSIGGKYNVKKEALGSNAVKIGTNKLRRRKS